MFNILPLMTEDDVILILAPKTPIYDGCEVLALLNAKKTRQTSKESGFMAEELLQQYGQNRESKAV